MVAWTNAQNARVTNGSAALAQAPMPHGVVLMLLVGGGVAVLNGVELFLLETEDESLRS